MVFYIDPVYFWYVFLPVLVISLGVQVYLRATVRKWGQVPNHAGLSGMQVGQQLFQHTDLHPIPLQRTAGEMTDHYDPLKNVVRLSDSTADKRTVAAMAITAHELGHVQQYQSGSALIKARGFLLPALQFSPTISYIAILFGLWFELTNLFWIGVLFFALMVLFSILTLPVEFDASRRGLTMLTESGLIQGEDTKGARQVLVAAGLTYLAAAITSILQLLYYISLAQRR